LGTGARLEAPDGGEERARVGHGLTRADGLQNARQQALIPVLEIGPVLGDPGRMPTAKASKSTKSSAKKPAAAKAKASKSTKSSAKKPALLTGGNPQIAKANGDDIGRRLDALIVRNVPNVRKAVRWNSPFYGIEGQGWFLGLHVFTHYVKVTFFRGTSLRPVPPGGTGKDARWIDIHEDDLDEAQMATWVKQAAAIPGWGKS
jgi:hypothetical protein